MKQHYSVTACQDVNLMTSNAARRHVDDSAWETIKAVVGKYPLPPGWQRSYAARSLTIRSRTGILCVKITVDMHVFIDRKLKGGFNYRSTHEHFSNLDAACNAVIDTIRQVSRT